MKPDPVHNPSILLLGYGNPGRGDDGLGPALAESIAARNLPNVTVDSDYQLTVEDGLAVAQHDVVVFADATEDQGVSTVRIQPVHPDGNAASFSSHSVEPPEVMTLATSMFGAKTRGYVLEIRGFEFNEFRESLSENARANLEKAIELIETIIQKNNFREFDKRGECQ